LSLWQRNLCLPRRKPKRGEEKRNNELKKEADQGIVVAHLHSRRGFHPEIGCVRIFQKWGMAKVYFLGINSNALPFSVDHMGREGT
jgi:hypothetical protein